MFDNLVLHTTMTPMATLPHASQILRCSYSGTYGGANWANVFHMWYSTGSPNQTDLDTLSAALSTQWSTQMASLIANTATLKQTQVVDLTNEFGLSSINTTTHPGAVSPAGALPASVAVCVSFKIGRRYRGGHPRMYLTGQNGANTTGTQSWSSTYTPTVKTAFDNWRAALNALTYPSMGSLQLVNLSYYQHKALRVTPVFDTIVGFQVHGRIDTQRRRLGKETA